jgi:hypothetical protein
MAPLARLLALCLAFTATISSAHAAGGEGVKAWAKRNFTVRDSLREQIKQVKLHLVDGNHAAAEKLAFSLKGQGARERGAIRDAHALVIQPHVEAFTSHIEAGRVSEAAQALHTANKMADRSKLTNGRTLVITLPTKQAELVRPELLRLRAAERQSK